MRPLFPSPSPHLCRPCLCHAAVGLDGAFHAQHTTTPAFAAAAALAAAPKPGATAAIPLAPSPSAANSPGSPHRARCWDTHHPDCARWAISNEAGTGPWSACVPQFSTPPSTMPAEQQATVPACALTACYHSPLPVPRAGINGAKLQPAAFVRRASAPLLSAITRLFRSQPRSTFIASTAVVPARHSGGPSSAAAVSPQRRLLAGPAAGGGAPASGTWLQVIVVAGGKAPLEMYRSSTAKLRYSRHAHDTFCMVPFGMLRSLRHAPTEHSSLEERQRRSLLKQREHSKPEPHSLMLQGPSAGCRAAPGQCTACGRPPGHPVPGEPWAV